MQKPRSYLRGVSDSTIVKSALIGDVWLRLYDAFGVRSIGRND